MRRTLCLALFLAATFCVSASADNIQLTGVGSNVQGGVYVVPYYLSVNHQDPLTVMCDDYSHEVYVGQSWDEHISDYSDLTGTRNGEAARHEYLELAWLYEMWLSNPTQAGDINFAAWAIFTPSVIGGNGWDAGAANWLSLAQGNDYSNFDTSGFIVITPDDLGPRGPQEYI